MESYQSELELVLARHQALVELSSSSKEIRKEAKMEKLICPTLGCGHEFCPDCVDLTDCAPYRRCCSCNKASEDRDWRSSENTRVTSRHWRGVG